MNADPADANAAAGVARSASVRDTVGRGVRTAVLGFVVFGALHLLFIAAWTDFFVLQPWPGYEESARLGLIEPWFVHSPRSLWLTRFSFFGVAFGVAFTRRHARWAGAAALWIGASAAIVAAWSMTSTRTLEGGGLGFAVYPFRVLLPIVLGTAIAELTRRTILPLRAS